MNLTKEQLLQNAEAYQAYAIGLPIEVIGKNEVWIDASNISGIDAHPFRPKPAPKTRPWNCPDDVPMNCWLRKVKQIGIYRQREDQVIGISELGVFTYGSEIAIDWEQLAEHREYSLDRKTWHPCIVTE